MKIASWNVNSLRVRLEHVQEWLASAQPDVLALQEIKMVDEQFPLTEIQETGYHAVFSGQKTYNGVAILSREPATDLIKAIPNFEDEQRRVLAATVNGVRIIDLYVPNGSSLDSDKFQYKLQWLKALHAWLQEELTKYDKLVVLGDFNIAPDDRDVHDPAAWVGHNLVSPEERNIFQGLINMGLVDTFRQFEQEEAIFSWWDYRNGAFWRNNGLRIDHILASTAMSQCCQSSNVDKKPRKKKRPSDHAPVVADFLLDS